MPDILRKTIIGYRLVIHAAGPGFHDKIELTLDHLSEADPEIVEINDLTYERYHGDGPDDYTEVRVDYIVARSLQPIYKNEPVGPRTDDEFDLEDPGFPPGMMPPHLREDP